MTDGAHYDVPLAAGAWAVLLVLVAAGALALALAPWWPRADSGGCCRPGSLGRHPLGDPGPDGVRRCDCGAVVSIPPGGTARLGTYRVTNRQDTPLRVQQHRRGPAAVGGPPDTEQLVAVAEVLAPRGTPLPRLAELGPLAMAVRPLPEEDR